MIKGSDLVQWLFKPPVAPQEQKQSKLGFFVDDSGAGEKVDETVSTVNRALIKRNNAFVYAVGYGCAAMTGAERSRMEQAKGVVIDTLAKSSEEIKQTMLFTAKKIAEDELSKYLPRDRAMYLSYFVAHDTVGFGPLSILIEDKQNIEEIEVNSPDSAISIYHAAYGRCTTNLRFSGEAAFRYAVNKLICEAEKELNEDSPIIDAQVENARIHAQIKPYAMSGAAATIRLHGDKRMGLLGLMKNETAQFEPLAYLWLALESGQNLIISGAPASGKTTLLSALMPFVPRFAKTVVIEEDVNELRFEPQIYNIVSLYGSKYKSNVTPKEQVINALRMRPDRIIVGEIRGEEAKEAFAGANLGIPFMTTMHSNDGGLSIVKRLLIKPMSVEPRAVGMMDVAVYMRHMDLRKRALSEIFEYRWLSRAEILSGGTEIGDSDAVSVSKMLEDGRLPAAVLETSKVIERYGAIKGISKKLVVKELLKRAKFLAEASESCKTDQELADKIHLYKLGM